MKKRDIKYIIILGILGAIIMKTIPLKYQFNLGFLVGWIGHIFYGIGKE